MRNAFLLMTMMLIAGGLISRSVNAGGGPENVVLLVDPRSDDALRVANHYKSVRNIPDRNILYLNPVPFDFQDFADFHRNALLGTLGFRGIDDHVDYIIIPPVEEFFVRSGDDLVDAAGCTPGGIGRFSASSVYTTTFVTEDILGGNLSVFEPNRYHNAGNVPRSFDSNEAWNQGQPSGSSSAKQYFIGFMLGYSGPRGNAIGEIIDMIDRSVASDGTRPVGTFYFMETDDDFRSPPRDPLFEDTINAMLADGAQAEEIMADLPIGETDCLGILTGEDNLPIEEGDFEVLPGAFCDHLTSFAATFDTGAQTKMSEWIRKGASGTMGTVEEPCVFGLPDGGIPGKFPHPQLHNWYFRGLSLGEALFRSIEWTPFQCLFYGDPLTQPFVYFPEVAVPDAPSENVSGVITITPSATTDSPSATIAQLDLHVDGKLVDTQSPGNTFTIDTTMFADGWHELRVIAFDDSDVRTQGRWVGEIVVDNNGLSATASSNISDGAVDGTYEITVGAAGSSVDEIQLRHNARVLAATDQDADSFTVHGSVLGQGTSRLFAVAVFEDGRRAVSAPLMLQTGAATGASQVIGDQPPVTFSYTLDVLPGQFLLVDFPVLDPDGISTTITITGLPPFAIPTTAYAATLVQIGSDATGEGSFTYSAVSALPSNQSTVTLRVCTAPDITRQPTNQEACAGEDVTFTVAAETGATFQWFRDDEPLPGETDASLTISNVSNDDQDLYSVEVTRRCGDVQNSTRSQSVQLIVPEAVAVTSGPSDAEFCAGESWTTFASAVNATSFQWLRDGQPLEGETSFFLFLPDLGIADGGSYTVQAINACGFAESDPAELLVTGCGDGDFDSDIDLADFGQFQLCRTPKPSPGLPPGCDAFDLDADFDVDLDDYDRFVDVVTGP